MSSTQIAASVLSIPVLVLAYKLLQRRRQSLPLPPSLPGLPIIGNLLQLPKSLEGQRYHELSQELGTDILYFNAVGTSIVILDTLEATIELFDNNWAKFSDRPYLPMAGDLMGWQTTTPYKNYGESLRQDRRLYHREMNIVPAKRFRPAQDRACKRMLGRLLEKKVVEVIDEARTVSGDIVMSMVYGMDDATAQAHYTKLAEDAIETVIEALVPGAFLVDALPFLKYVPSWIPGASFKKQAKIGSHKRELMYKEPLKWTKDQISSGKATPSFAGYCLEGLDEGVYGNATEETLITAAGTAYAAGGDTTRATLSNAVWIFVNHPEAVKRAQEEIDRVLGEGILPGFDDEAILPYTSSLIKETKRWQTPFPLGLPHSTPEGGEYKGYWIPKGSIVMGNCWAILHNDAVYPDPHSFKPDRFLTPDGKSIDTTVFDPSIPTFGYGRRVCPGRHVAEASVWIVLSSMIAAFNMSRTDETGGPDHPFAAGALRVPLPFNVRFEPRSPAYAKLIRVEQD